MIKYTLDEKEQITDRKGNTIVNLAKSIFSRNAGIVKDYEILKMTDYYQMRPDLVSQAMYDSDEYAEFILKFSGISNPFSLDKEDVLMIPNNSQAIGMMSVNDDEVKHERTEGTIAQIRNFFKFVNQEYKSDDTAYKNLAEKEIPSGIIDTTQRKEYIVPYISDDGRTAVTVRNGRMYFGEDAGIPTANNLSSTTEGVTKSVESIINNAITKLSDTNCMYNGTLLSDFVRSNFNNN